MPFTCAHRLINANATMRTCGCPEATAFVRTENERKLYGDSFINHLHTYQIFQLIFSGLLAGFEIGVHYGIATAPESLGETAQIVLRQAMTRRLRVLAPVLFLPAFLLALVVIVQEGQKPGMWLRCVGIAGLMVWILIRIVATVPVNSAAMEWNPELPPANWRTLIEKTERFHVVAAWATVSSFVCFLVSAI